MILALLSLIVGLVLGLLLAVNVPAYLEVYLICLTLSSMTALAEAAADLKEGSFQPVYTGISFLGNSVVALAIVGLGQMLNFGLIYVIYFAFGNKLFLALTRIWRKIAIDRELTGKQDRMP